MKYRDRIVGLCRLRPDRILANPINWRTHPEEQRAAMRGVLADVGIGDALIAVPADEAAQREVQALKKPVARAEWLAKFEAGTGDVMLLDGHLRGEEIRDQPIPVLILDLLPAEQAEFLATFDPIGALAGKSVEKLDAVLRQFNSTNADVQALVVKVRGDVDAAAAQFTGGEGTGNDGGGPGVRGDPDGREFDENIASDVDAVTCPGCGLKFPRGTP